MADINEILNQILNAVYGKDVRQSIVNGISQCYADGKAGVNDLQARQLIEAVAAANEEQQSALQVLESRVEELEQGEGGSSQQSTTIDIPTVLVDGGVVENVQVNNNSTKTQHVTFTTAFTETPKVMVAIGKNVGAVNQYAYLSANILYPTVTTTGFDFFLANRTGSDRSPGVVWFAYQPTTRSIDLDITIPDADGMSESEVRAITGPIASAVDAIKTGYDGTVYQTAAEAVRTQINDLHVLIGDEPGTAINASSIGYKDSNVSEALDELDERLDGYEDTFTGDIDESVQSWLDEHPEATTTVQNGSITESKLSDSLKNAVKDSVLNMTAIDMADSATTNLGDCTVFHGDVNGIVDFGADPNVPNLLAFLSENSITRIDFVIISHYHGDHVTSNFATALGTLVNGGIDFSECVFYLPHKGIDWSRFTGSDNQSNRETLVKSTLSENNFSYIEPINGQAVSVTPYTSITFWNIGDYNDYYTCYVNGRGVPTNFTVYNNFSMIAVLDHCGTTFLLSGDVHELAQSKNYQHIEKCNVYKVEHHGVNSIIDADWQARIVPEFVVVEQYAKDSYNTLEILMPQLRRYCDRGAKLLFNGSGTTTIQSKGGELYQKSGGCFNLSITASLGGGEPIPVNSDLNDYVEIGQYYCNMNATVATLSNCPVANAFRMVVENPRGLDSGETLYRLQKLTPIVSGTEYKRYVTIASGVASFSDWTPEIITLTPHPDGSACFTDLGNTKVIRNGSLCIVRIEGTILASTSGWTTIFYNAPKAAKGETLPANLIANNGTIVRARVTSYGSLQIHVPVEPPANTNIGTTFVYIA